MSFLIFRLKTGCFAADNEKYIDIKISVKDSFAENELMKFSFQISNVSAKKEKLEFIPSIECEKNIPQKMPDLREAEASSVSVYKDVYEGIIAAPEFESQKCIAAVALLKPYEDIFKKEFFVDTKPKIDVRFIFCETQDCGREQKKIIINSPVFISYTGKQNFPIQAEITSPNNKKDIINLPAWHTFKEIGAYKIEFSLELDGFQPIKETRNIEAENGEIRVDETPQTNSVIIQRNENADSPSNRNFLILIIFAAVLFMISIIFYFYKKKKNSGEKQ